MAIAIEFENVGKQYRLGLVSTQTLSHDLNRWWQMNILHKEDPYLRIGETNDRSSKGSSDYVWALRDINFRVEQGDVVGIIGRNGAGKSTLLKLLSKVTGPTTGQIRARGRIGSLLEVGTGFHPEMTGRENIFMNGAILGMTKPEIARKLDEIVDFSGCERYLDTPVKRYSSGMMVRLGFAVAAHLDPEILVVDEVLAVGDAEFQKKAIGKMKDVSQGEGRTVLFVSHNMAAVRSLCKSGVLLRNGCVNYMGTADDCVSKYMDNNDNDTISFWSPTTNPEIRVEHRHNDVVFESIELLGNKTEFFTVDEIPIEIVLKANADVPNCRINSTTNSISDVPVGTVMGTDSFPMKAGERKRIRLTIYNHNMVAGVYSPSFAIGYGSVETGLKDFEIVFNPIRFRICGYSKGVDYYNWGSYRGNTLFPHRVEVIEG